MTTPILQITEVANGQVDQYLTVNEAMRIIEAASDIVYIYDGISPNVKASFQRRATGVGQGITFSTSNLISANSGDDLIDVQGRALSTRS